MVRICQPRRSWSAPKWTVAIPHFDAEQSPPTTRHGISKRAKTAALGQQYVISAGDAVGAWWWEQYKARHLAEQKARSQWLLDHTVEGNGYGLLPMPVAHGVLLHDPDPDVADFVAALRSKCLISARSIRPRRPAS